MTKRKRASRSNNVSKDEYNYGLDSESDDSFHVGPSRQSKPTKKIQHSKHITIENEDHESAHSIPHAVSVHVVNSQIINEIRMALLAWYDKVHETRGMPWRKPFDASLGVEERAQRAYEVWISEIMLQQTQVVTVIPYYNRWMEKFPTIRDLAASDIEVVNNLWKGLGYYSRAARLLKGAQKAVADFGGRLPDNAKDMEAQIPGVGRYSAGAVCSIAYNQCAPVLDGNVQRLLSRFLALHAPPKSKQTLDILWTAAEAFVERSARPGDINQALIELGSTVCKVRDPACSECPLQLWCEAYKRSCQQVDDEVVAEAEIEELCSLCQPLPQGEVGLVTIYPMKVARKKAREELDSVNVIEWRNEDKSKRLFLLVRRPEGGLLAGLHEFPTVSNISGAAASASALLKTAGTLVEKYLVHPPPPFNLKISNAPLGAGVRITQIKPAGDVLHVFSHIRKTYRAQWVVLEGGTDPPELTFTSSTSTGKPQKSRGKAKGKGKACHNSDADTPESARWIPLDAVEDSNIGTGVLKVWNQVKALWTN
ncbi:DNA glycosylase [Hygrophoropsis aurantiaca]|uniref:DNA glycosylase n=1 Tax=Hygrophoropsis aurantiaca TaxID=72124 RepID=A0ACB8A5R1_9AGAM|nr:DNA glycosylase [Hygrophoropsis aurantiaca]